jgi:protein-L-isoaspartate O-methyltransferase
MRAGANIVCLAREEMVERNIAARGVRDELVLGAMRKVPRESFLPKNLREFAYEDSPLSLAGEQAISPRGGRRPAGSGVP